jgi:hypothetical protein
MPDAQLEDFLDADDPLVPWDGGTERVQDGRLAGLGAAGDNDVEAGDDAGVEELGGLAGEGAKVDEIGQPGRLRDELADVDPE